MKDSLLQKIKECGEKTDLRERWLSTDSFPDFTKNEEDIIAEITDYLIKNKNFSDTIKMYGMTIHVDTKIHPKILYILYCHAYEEADIALIEKHLSQGEKVLVLGSGIGVIASKIGQKTRMKVIAVDADDQLEDLLIQNARANNVAVEFIHGAVSDKDEEFITFHKAEEFWRSGCYSNDVGRVEAEVKVPVIDWIELIETNNLNVLFMDIEGTESTVFDNVELPSALKKILVEIHVPKIGKAARDHIIATLAKKGFEKKDQMGMTYYFERA